VRQADRRPAATIGAAGFDSASARAQSSIASEAASARDAHAGIAWAIQEMSEVGDSGYVQCRAAILAEVCANPDLAPAQMFAWKRERKACLDARGFVLGLVPDGLATP
jgi:hypothetical protein